MVHELRWTSSRCSGSLSLLSHERLLLLLLLLLLLMMLLLLLSLVLVLHSIHSFKQRVERGPMRRRRRWGIAGASTVTEGRRFLSYRTYWRKQAWIGG